jgi:predicted nucleic acid-binding protein
LEEKSEAVAVDTYAILAMAYGELGKRAEEVLTRVRRGEAVGYLPATVVYELCVHWLRGRIPTLKSMEEVVTLVSRYFRVVELKIDDYVESARLKVKGDRILRESSEIIAKCTE